MYLGIKHVGKTYKTHVLNEDDVMAGTTDNCKGSSKQRRRKARRLTLCDPTVFGVYCAVFGTLWKWELEVPPEQWGLTIALFGWMFIHFIEGWGALTFFRWLAAQDGRAPHCGKWTHIAAIATALVLTLIALVLYVTRH